MPFCFLARVGSQRRLQQLQFVFVAFRRKRRAAHVNPGPVPHRVDILSARQHNAIDRRYKLLASIEIPDRNPERNRSFRMASK